MVYCFLCVITVEVFTSCIARYLLQEFQVELGNYYLAIAVAFISLSTSFFYRNRCSFFSTNTYSVNMHPFFLCFRSNFSSPHFVIFTIAEDKEQASCRGFVIEIIACHTYCLLNSCTLRGKHIGIHTLEKHFCRRMVGCEC